MVSGTRSSAIDSGVLKALTDLTDAEILVLKDTYKLATIDDLALLDKDDIDTILGIEPATFMKRRKLSAISQYMKYGGNVNASTTMADIYEQLAQITTGTATTVSSAPSVALSTTSHDPIRLSSSDFPTFSGALEDQEIFKSKAEAQIGQTVFKFLLKRDATTPNEKERDEELFNVFKNSFLEGKAYHLISRSLSDSTGAALPPSGRRVWQQFEAWCNSGGRKQTVLKNIKRDLKALKLDGDTVDGFEYVNKFITHHNKLVQIGAKSSKPDLLVDFVENIIDPDFDTVRQLLVNYNLEIDRGTRPIVTKEFFDMVENRQRYLSEIAESDMDLKSRQYIRNDNDSYSTRSGSGRSNANKEFFNLPHPLWMSLSQKQRKAFLAHKRAVQDGKTILEERLKEILAEGSGGDGDKKNKRKKIRAIKICRSTSQMDDPSTEDVRIIFKSDDDMDSSSDDDSSSKSTPPNLTSTNTCNIKTNKVLHKGSSSIVGNDSIAFPFATILDSGTEWSVAGSPAWSIIKNYQQSLNMAAVDADMHSVPMRLCDAVTDVLNGDGQLSLFGVRRCGYSPTLTDNEAVINTHFLREAGWTVDCIANRHGGTQSLSPSQGETWPMGYDANKYKLYLQCRPPTATELRRLPIHWVTCRIEDLAIEKGQVSIRRRPIAIQSPVVLQPSTIATAPEMISTNPDAGNITSGKDGLSSRKKDNQLTVIVDPTLNQKDGETPTEIQRSDESNSEPTTAPASTPTKDDVSKSTPPEEKIDFQKTLCDLTDLVAAKTIKATTQYYPNCIEAENRSYPRQHRQTRLHALHCKRIPGRTCGDTFFSSIKSVRGYTCVQLFVATTWDFTWVKLLRRESQVPGSYTDFCKEVGAPNELLTDNSKVQSGCKFQEINRQNQTDHHFSTPHCQKSKLC